MAATHPTEETDRLDRDLREAYTATPWIVLSDKTVEPIRNAGGVSKPAPIPEDIEVVEVQTATAAGTLYKKRGGDASAPLMVWMHGGGGVFGFPALHAGLYVQFVQGTGCSVYAAKYPLAPEHVYPAANEAALKAWEWATTGGLKEYGLTPPKGLVALGGTSFGGGLAATTAVRIRDSGKLEAPCGLLLNIPWLAPPPTDAKPEGTSYTSVKFDRIWSLKNCQYAYEAGYQSGYADKASDPKGHAFAVNAPSLADLPPCQVSVSEHDVLRDSGIAFAQRLFSESKAGAELHVWKGAYHGNTGAAPNAPISRAHDSQQVRFAQRIFGK